MNVVRVRMPLPSNDHATLDLIGSVCGEPTRDQIARMFCSESEEMETRFIQRPNV